MKHLALGLLGLLLLAACNAFEPKATVRVDILPAEADAHTLLWGENYKILGEYEGDFTASVPAGRVRVSVSADGYDSRSVERTLAPGETADITVQLVERVRVSFTSFSVTRYQTARLYMSNVVSANYSGGLTLRASCKEDGYSSLTTSLSGHANLAQGNAQSVTLTHSGGFPYFTSNTVRCSFNGETDGGTTVVVN